MNQNVRLAIAILVGALVGAVLNELLLAAGSPEWVTQLLPVGLDPPFTLDLIFIQVTFGATLSLSFPAVVGMLTALVAFHRRGA